MVWIDKKDTFYVQNKNIENKIKISIANFFIFRNILYFMFICKFWSM